MAIYKISWVFESDAWVDVEASSKEEAIEKFTNQEWLGQADSEPSQKRKRIKVEKHQ